MDYKNLGLSVVAILIAIFAYFHHSAAPNPFVANGIKLGTLTSALTPSCGGSVTCLLGDFYASASITSGTTLTAGGLFTDTAGSLKAYTSATTTMTNTATLVAADFTAYDTVILNPNVTGNSTITLPASSTISTFLPTAGNSQTTCFINGTTTAGTFYTFAGGTGTTLLVASSSVTAVGAKTIYPQKMGCFTFTRGNATATTFDILSAFTAFN